jgi:hypothetical protein
MAKVKVTKDHIKRGEQESAAHCPVALAVRDYMKGYKDGTIFVDHEIIEIGHFSFFSPRSVARFIRKYDAGRPVKPFTFTLRSA